MFDAHCHLHFEPDASTRTSLLEQRRNRGLEGSVLADYDDVKRQDLLQMVDAHPDVFGCLGLHPWAIQPLDDEALDAQLECLQNALEQHHQHIIAIGESGLDHHVTLRHRAPEQFKARQQRALDAQCALASQYDLPIVLHQVRAAQPLFHQMKSHHTLSFMLHAFDGHPQQAQQFLKLRHDDRQVLCSFGPALTWLHAEKARQALKWIAQHAPSCWTLETDAPDRPPEGLDGQGDAYWLSRVVQVAAQVLAVSEADVASIAQRNARTFFGLNR